MNITLSLKIGLYILIWFLCLFIVLPFGSGKKQGEQRPKGTDRGAPLQAHMGKKIIFNTLFAGIICTIVIMVLEHGSEEWIAPLIDIIWQD
ncbi:MAG: DUF1467 family protein [Parvibaculales bacterium]